VQLGEELQETAVQFEDSYSWNTSTPLRERNLTGFSHGTAGIGYALLELYNVTGNMSYRRAGELAFNYERYWFDAEKGNWPDFRGETARGKRNKQPLSFGISWCHGAPGIALSRLRAYEILKDERCKGEALTALQTTRAMIEARLHTETMNFSLCHGLAGNAEVLLIGNQVLDHEFSCGFQVASEVARAGIKRYAAPNHPWPCGAGGGTTPSLMLGLAGIGYFYLRLHDSAIPSILILQCQNVFNRRKP
jgi:lantibiotic modifying enzyme